MRTVRKLPNGFYVEDDGPGIPNDERDDVFKTGYSTSNGAIGFSLSTVKQVAEAHGWEICVTDGSEGGTRFETTGVEFNAESPGSASLRTAYELTLSRDGYLDGPFVAQHQTTIGLEQTE